MKKLIPFICLMTATVLAPSLPAKVTIKDGESAPAVVPVTGSVNAIPTRIQWEYKTEYYQQLSEKRLNDFGKQGWELVGFSTNQDRNQNVSYSYVFKRPKQIAPQ
ncbi:DUF4177 domain-containing protein [Cerasicoccus maritimus]|uniref:DUF4177 domain-containing protein n=1 Tax=Cerasicoccus maritimus TaxID=490089 RepID=UPI002852C214|nr:DUF4177 domain-containing protein [Cerasicoccus maritimus]